jgi:hypothetical protein
MPGFYIKQSEWGRKQDSGETECVCERQRVAEKDSIGHKIDRWRKHLVTDVCD